jgi:microcystin degradation protein MlrC
MKRVLVGKLKQETATFNPSPTRYEDFQVHFGEEILRASRGTRAELAGAIEVLEAAGVEVVPTMAAEAVPGGTIPTADLDRLLEELAGAIRSRPEADGALLCLHGAMAGAEEGDPEGRLLREVRKILGPRPLVVSLDLHAVLTDAMVGAADLLVAFHTYPHVDQHETGRRAARNLLGLLAGEVRPAAARVPIPLLARGDELLTATGLFGEAVRMCREIESSPGGLAAGVLIGNPFTDVPALRSNVLVTTDGDAPRAREEALRIARFMWKHRERFQAALTPIDEALRLADATRGLTVFSDAADATSSGASGDSNEILKGLLRRPIRGRALVPIVDAPAVEKAHAAGAGARIEIPLGGTLDRARFTPVAVAAEVRSLHDGRFKYEDGTEERAGRVAVLRTGRIDLLVAERAVYFVGRKVFQSHGLEPAEYDLVVVKSPNGFRTHYQAIAARIVPVDVPGSTSANLRSLPYRNCPRPIFPLDADARPEFEP